MVWQFDQDISQRVTQLAAGNYPVVYVETWEEERLEYLLSASSTGAEKMPVWRWSASAGFAAGPGAAEDRSEPVSALAFIRDSSEKALWLMWDLPMYLHDHPELIRLVRDIHDKFLTAQGSLILSCPTRLMAPSLAREMHFFRLPLPSSKELASYLGVRNEQLSQEQRLSPEWLEHWAAEMAGLTINEADILFRRLLRGGNLDREDARTIIREQRSQRVLNDSGLEVLDNELDLQSLGGLTALKRWIASRRELFGLEAQRAGIEPPTGILMMGVSGCGKSLAAKVIACEWKLPLVRLDMNLIMSGAWGSPELAWARALESIESVAPVVVWLDEIENSFGYADGRATGGNSTIFSSFLTWMQEKAAQIFVVATANNINLLPAEMLRKGRFDELFFLDLPTPEARVEILAIHLRKQGADPASFDLPQLAGFLEGWTASEIEQLVKAAKLDAFYQRRDLGFGDLKTTAFNMVPLSKTMAEQIAELRRWARSRAMSAD